MIKKLSLIGGLMMLLSLSSLYAQGGASWLHMTSVPVVKFSSITNHYSMRKDAFRDAFSITSKIDTKQADIMNLINNSLNIMPQALFGVYDGISNTLIFRLNFFQYYSANKGALNIEYIVFSDGNNYVNWKLDMFGTVGELKYLTATDIVVQHILQFPLQHIDPLYNLIKNLNGKPLLVRIGASVGGFDTKLEGATVRAIKDVLDIYMQIK